MIFKYMQMQIYAVIYSTDLMTLQDNLNAVVAWSNRNLLTLNKKKTKWMIIGKNTRYVGKDNNLYVNGAPLEQVFSFNYLGLIIDTSLACREHRAKVMKQVQLKLNYLVKIRKYLNTDAALTIYKSTILPIFDYADFIYDQQIKYSNKLLQQLQNRALRIIYNQHIMQYNLRLSTTNLHERANIHRLVYRRQQHLIHYAFDMKFKHNKVDIRPIPTRAHSAIRLKVTKVKNVRYYRSIEYRACQAWNNLERSLTMVNEKTSLKKQLKNSYPNPYIEL